MKRSPILILLILFAFVLSGCSMNSPVGGIIYTDVKSPQGDKVKLTAKGFERMGKSECSAILGLVATGDCSLEAAMRNGKISEVHHVDHQYKSILFFYERYETHVYGE